MTAATQRGTTTVTDQAVRKIAERAADESATAQAPGTAASAHACRARANLDVSLPCPPPPAETVHSPHEHVADHTGELTGIDVTSARIRVTSLAPATGVGQEHRSAPADRAPRRLSSRRRVPAAVLSAVATAVCGVLALDLVLVHAAHHSTALWRSETVRRLSQHGPGDRSVTVASGLTVLLGLWMIVLAVTPGLLRRRTVHSPAPRVAAAVDRPVIESLARDAVGGVPDAGTVHVSGRRRRLSVRASLLFGERSSANAAVTAAVDSTPASCGPRRPHRLRVRLTPAAVPKPPTPNTPSTQAHTPPALGTVPGGEA
ncbi:hypothetical protein SAMN06272735_8481 [Streptomyces sp. TLI_55]|uniref:DUF6286 domain-containing protein n=1 Tax=Streptomyces sp. TLI_55 TaxID=1938861 RepID=UPI000BDB229F|nr:DUF6286 domain-containing protein [Streptomyces sp. TLI_55]SNX66590.1 hypothetical protein SAMN06272735_8481 [Streptomyces sp. TLI_55]